jgi:hypothetical protein
MKFNVLVSTICLSCAWAAPAPAVTIFTDSGVNAASITDTVNDFRAALGNPNNANNPGPLFSGRREINWDGGGPPVIDGTAPVTPFTTFQNTRGATFTTPGTGLTQAAATGGALSLDLIMPSTPRSSPLSARTACSRRSAAILPMASFPSRARAAPHRQA